MKKKVLLIEDDPNISELIEININDLGYSLDHAQDGESGLHKAKKNDYALIILDIMLPKLDGLEVCKQIRAMDKYIPVLMLTAKSEEFDKVLGLEIGADDYITKPFSVREFVARIKAIIRLRESSLKSRDEYLENEELDFGDLTINFKMRRVILNGEEIKLTSKEFELLALFASHPGRPYSRNELLDLVWGYQFEGYHHTVNSHINRLRNKIEVNPAEPNYIKTVWGYGYRFTEEEKSVK